MINPYEAVDWANNKKIISISHAHATTQTVFDYLYNGGCRHMALSNYRPSVPYYPLPYGEITEIPEDVISCPNAEHFGLGIPDAHFNGLGINYETGTESRGWGITSWKIGFPILLSHLLYTDGGGITINHPQWTNRNTVNLSVETMLEMLDFDERVLGVELSSGYGRFTLNDDPNWDSRMWWDQILITGRKCWGFCVPDHDAEAETGWTGENWSGQNILLVPSTTGTGESANHECLKAYRGGRFFSRLKQGTLVFTSITVNGNEISVETNEAETIKFIVDGESETVEGSSAVYTAPSDAVYVRIEASNDDNTVFSNPITFKEYIPDSRKKNKRVFKSTIYMG